jgi:hypothetical protein
MHQEECQNTHVNYQLFVCGCEIIKNYNMVLVITELLSNLSTESYLDSELTWKYFSHIDNPHRDLYFV